MARSKDAKVAASALRKALGDFTGDLTVADAAARSGLALRDAEAALFGLLEEHPGRLKATEGGDVLFSFPEGFRRQRKGRSWWERGLKWLGRTAAGVGRFVVRTWITGVLVGYAVAFVAILIALAVSGKGDDDRGIGGLGTLIHILFRVVLEALWWNFHPFSPIAWARYERMERGEPEEKESFYEKVNRFVYGPDPVDEPPEVTERKLIALIRKNQGRIGLFDVLKLTGLSREVAEPLLARLMLDYEGDVDVDDNGGITYSFPELRRTAGGRHEARLTPAWTEKLELPPLTGNSAGANFLIGGINLFNLMVGLVGISLGLTVENIAYLFQGIPIESLPTDGVAWLFGIVPVVFSTLIFALPLSRLLKRPSEQKKAERENGRRGLLRLFMQKAERPTADATEAGYDQAAVMRAWKAMAGKPPAKGELERELLALGGELEVDDNGRTRYVIPELEAERVAVSAARSSAQAEEAQVGDVVFDSGR